MQLPKEPKRLPRLPLFDSDHDCEDVACRQRRRRTKQSQQGDDEEEETAALTPDSSWWSETDDDDDNSTTIVFLPETFLSPNRKRKRQTAMKRDLLKRTMLWALIVVTWLSSLWVLDRLGAGRSWKFPTSKERAILLTRLRQQPTGHQLTVLLGPDVPRHVVAHAIRYYRPCPVVAASVLSSSEKSVETTPAVFSFNVAGDQRLPTCDQLSVALDIWRHDPVRPVGWNGRAMIVHRHFLSRHDSDDDCTSAYVSALTGLAPIRMHPSLGGIHDDDECMRQVRRMSGRLVLADTVRVQRSSSEFAD